MSPSPSNKSPFPYFWIVVFRAHFRSAGKIEHQLKPIERRQLWRIASALFAFATAIFVVGFPLGILTRERPVGAALQPTPWNFAFVSLLLVLLLVGASDRKNLVVRPILRFFGEIRYGLYLFHVLCFDVYDALIPPLLSDSSRCCAKRCTSTRSQLSLRSLCCVFVSWSRPLQRFWFLTPRAAGSRLLFSALRIACQTAIPFRGGS
jgi:peptidoglycan/LPS O-acetylase OafA/YrhL